MSELSSDTTSPTKTIVRRATAPNSPWLNPLVCARVKELWADHTGVQITWALRREFGLTVTRCAVMGFLRRHKITSEHKREVHPKTRGPKFTKPKREPLKHRPALTIIRANGNSNQLRLHQTIKAELRPLRDVVDLEPMHLSFEQLEAGHCRFPYGDDPARMTFCGHEQREGSSYCWQHHGLCWNEPKPFLPRGGV